MTKEGKEKLIDKLRKLMRHQESAVKLGNVEEAQAFAEKVSELMFTHKIGLTDLEIKEETEASKVDRTTVRAGKHSRRRVAWQEDLASVIADAHQCRLLIHPGSNWITFVGLEADREVAVWMFQYLSATLSAAENKEYWRLYCRLEREHGGTGAGSTDATYGFRQTFRTAFISTVARRYREIKRAAETKAAAAGSTALVVVERAVDLWFKEQKFKKTATVLTGNQGDFNPHGYEKGREYGQKVNLGKRVLTQRGK